MTDNRQTIADQVTTLSTPSDREIVTERIFGATRERVFAAFTDPELIPKWWGLESTTTIVDRLDLRPGGAWRFIERNPDGSESGFRGTYREVTPPERIAYTFEWEGMPGHVIVNTATFEDLGESTKVTINSLFHTTEERNWMLDAGMERGLNESYRSLERLLKEVAAS